MTRLPVRNTQAEINNDPFWMLTQKGWAFDTIGGDKRYPAKGSANSEYSAR